MHEITKLKLDIFKTMEYDKAQKEWRKAYEVIDARGRHGSNSVNQFLDIYFNCISALLAKLFDAERDLLSVSNEQPDEYFIDLTDEIIRFFDTELNTIHAKAMQQFSDDSRANQLIASRIEEYRTKQKDSIIKKVALLNLETKNLDQKAPNKAVDKLDEIPTFDFVINEKLRPLLIRDYKEIVSCKENDCWKSVVILCGSSIEAILYDIIKQNESKAKSLSSAPNRKGKTLPLEEWKLDSLITVACGLGLISKGLTALNHSAKEFRNLIHPREEMKGNYKLQKEEAENALIVLKTLIRDVTEGNNVTRDRNK